MSDVTIYRCTSCDRQETRRARGWFRRPPAPAVHRSVDEATFLGAQFDLLTAQLDVERKRAAVLELENARLRAALAPYKHQELMRAGLAYYLQRGRGGANAVPTGDEPTVVTDAAPFRRPAGPAPATEQWPR